jgi:hypothetical protein
MRMIDGLHVTSPTLQNVPPTDVKYIAGMSQVDRSISLKDIVCAPSEMSGNA